MTPLAFLERVALVHPADTAVVDGPRRVTFAALAAQATWFAHALAASGVQPGDRVALLARNSAEVIAANFAVPLAGAVIVPLNTRLAAAEVAAILRHSGARLLLADPDLLTPDLAGRVTRPLVVLPRQDGTAAPAAAGVAAITWAEFWARGSDAPLPWTAADENLPLTLNYTSGTTGRPRGVLHTHRSAYLNALGHALHQRLTQESVYLWTLPMFHCNGWASIWAAVAVGARQVCLRSVDGPLAWALIEQEGVSHLAGTDAALRIVADAAAGRRFSRPVTVHTGGTPPAPAFIARFLELGAQVVHGYGMTETGGPYTVCEEQPGWRDRPLPEYAGLLARQGVPQVTAGPLRVVEVRADDQLVDVPSDGATVGEVVASGNTLMAGYHDDPAGTAEAFRGGWLHTGDLAVRHPDGYIQITDRLKDIIVSGGENISPAEVEQALLTHEAVAEVAIVGVPDARWGERPKAFVVARHAVDPADLIAHAAASIARFKVPRAIEFTDQLPRTATGKVQKHLLRAAP
ncbi:MAG: AMP-binding protein [Propionibacteriaceae bacterium]|nr:AMP-binding protein [Propionibacteriaceae bacterium]